MPLRVLSWDGGGVWGLSTLLILHELMKRLAVKQKVAEVRPCDCFELIIGAGTGGISALLLGRMRLTEDKAIEAYIKIAEAAFTQSSVLSAILPGQGVTLNGDALDRVIGDIVERSLGDRDAKLGEIQGVDNYNICHTAVLATTSANADAPPHIFRSYTSHRPASSFTIREVARATLSTAGVFPSTSLGNPPTLFVDAGISGYNDPTEVVIGEISDVWRGHGCDCLVSLGTGVQKIDKVGNGWEGVAQACRTITESCERVHNNISGMSRREGLPYFRFSVDRGLDGVEFMDPTEARFRGDLTGITDSYM